MIEQRPYPSEHSARISDPGHYDEFRRENDKFGSGIHAIWGIKTKPKRIVELQSIRFDAKKFTAAEAKKWLKDHNYKPISLNQRLVKKRLRQVCFSGGQRLVRKGLTRMNVLLIYLLALRNRLRDTLEQKFWIMKKNLLD